MTILSTVCTKLLCTNAHLGRRVAAHHFKVYIRGSRNGIAILDSDKTLICLRSALHFIGSLIHKKGRSFFLKTKNFFLNLIMAKMIYSIMAKMGSCINDSQWKIGAFLTNSDANPKKFRSRKKKIHFGLNQQPDCVVIPNPDRKSSVILEANRLQIPIASLVDSTSPWQSYKRITYPIPANDTRQFMYLFPNSITKTVIAILERPRITAMNRQGAGASTLRGIRPYSSASHSSPRRKPSPRRKLFFFCVGGIGVLLLQVLACYLDITGELLDVFVEHFEKLLPELCGELFMYLPFLPNFLEGHSGTPGTVSSEKQPSKVEWQKPLLMEAGEGSTREERKRKAPINLIDSPPRIRSRGDLIEVPDSSEEAAAAPVEPGEEVQQGAVEPEFNVGVLPDVPQEELFGAIPQNLGPALPQVPPAPAAHVPPAGPEAPDIDPQIQNTKGKIYFNLTTLYGSMDPRQATEFTDIIFDRKDKILKELRRLDNVNNQILWQDGGDTIRDPQSGGEYHPLMLDLVLDSLKKYGQNSEYYKRFLNNRIDTLSNDDLMNLKREDLPMEKLNPLNQAKLTDVKWGRGR